MSRIAMVAAPYCFGPTSKLLCVADELATRHELMYFGAEPGLSLAGDTSFTEKFTLRDRDRWDSASLTALETSDIVVSFLDYRCLPLAAERGITSAFFDTLLWTRSETPPHIELATRYVAQAFFEEGRARVPIPLKRVGPVLPAQMELPRDGGGETGPLRVVVSFGGLRSPAMVPSADIRYVRDALALLRAAVVPGVSLRICVPAYLASELANESTPDMMICSPSRREFHESLRSCDLLVTVPGLEVVYEALAIHVPIVFFPPYNGTQLHQGRSYRRLGLGLFSMWPDDLDSLPADADLTSLTSLVQTRAATGSARRSMANEHAGKLRECLLQAVASRQGLHAAARKGHALLGTLGVAGRATAASAIEALL